MPATPKPYRLPTRFDSATLLKQAKPGETILVVKVCGVGSTSPYEYMDTAGRQAVFRFDLKYGGHIMRVPASIWNDRKGEMAHALMEQRRLPYPIVVLSESPAPQISSQLPGHAWVQAMELLSTLAPSMEINVDDPLGMAQTILDTISQQQVGQEAKSSGPYPEAGGSSPPPATNSPDEMGASEQGQSSPNVVGQGDTLPDAPASETFSTDASVDADEPSYIPVPASLSSRAWELLEKPMRLKAIAALLETDEDTLKSAIAEPLSTIELGHAGWVKRREPQA